MVSNGKPVSILAKFRDMKGALVGTIRQGKTGSLGGVFWPENARYEDLLSPDPLSAPPDPLNTESV